MSNKGNNPTPKKAITRNRDWREPFLLELSRTGVVSAACAYAMVDKTTVYERRKDDPEFERRWKESLGEAADLLELEARRRAEHGVDEPVIYQGTLAGQWVDPSGNPCKQEIEGAKFIPLTIKKYSDTLIMFLLNGARPNKYRRNVNHSGTIKHKHSAKKAAAKAMSDPETAGMLRALARRMHPAKPNDN